MDGDGAVQPTEARSAASRREPPWLRRTILLVAAAVAGYQMASWAFFRLGSFLGLLFLSWMFSISLEPLVRALVRRGVRRGLAAGLLLLAVVLFAVGFFASFGTLLVDQLGQLIRSLPHLVRDTVGWADRTFHARLRSEDVLSGLDLTPGRLQQLVQQFSPGVVGIITAAGRVVFGGVTILVFGFFMSAQAPQLRETVSRWFPARQQQVISNVWAIAVDKTGGYVLSRLILAVLSTVVTAVYLVLLGVPYWLPLAIWTGLLSEFIPVVGMYLAMLLPALVALSLRPVDALWVIVAATAYRQIEDYLIAPHITARTVEIHPAMALGAVIAGAALFGPLGALVATPVVAAIQSVIETYGHRYDLAAADEEQPADGSAPRRWPRLRRSKAGGADQAIPGFDDERASLASEPEHSAGPPTAPAPRRARGADMVRGQHPHPGRAR